MRSLNDFKNKKIKFVFCDIDDTLTHDGKLPAASYAALWDLHNKGLHVIPVTGRPAGWCEMIARFWPVSGVVGENGAFYFRYKEIQHKERKMHRHYSISDTAIKKNRKKLDKISKEILKKVKGSAVASDQFARIFDLAIDFCEDVKPLKEQDIQSIVNIFKKNGATAKVSSIHVNGWFGQYDKLKMCKTFLKKEFQIDITKDNELCCFIGDSPNDEPMFAFFKNSFGVANIKKFENSLKHCPEFITPSPGAEGFVEFSRALLGVT